MRIIYLISLIFLIGCSKSHTYEDRIENQIKESSLKVVDSLFLNEMFKEKPEFVSLKLDSTKVLEILKLRNKNFNFLNKYEKVYSLEDSLFINDYKEFIIQNTNENDSIIGYVSIVKTRLDFDITKGYENLITEQQKIELQEAKIAFKHAITIPLIFDKDCKFRSIKE